MDIIVLDNGDGSVGILTPCLEYVERLKGTDATGVNGEPLTLTGADVLRSIAERDGGGKPFKVVDVSSIPTDRTFRSAWGIQADGVGVDMPRARIIQMDRIRLRRDSRLLELDLEERLADRGNHPGGKSTADIQSEKNILCEIPQSFDLTGAATPDELAALWPDELGPK